MYMYTYLHRVLFNYITYKCFVTMNNIDNVREIDSVYLNQGYT